MADRQSIRRALKRHERHLRRAYKVKRLAIFGSVARGTARRNSDVDLLIEFQDPPGLVGFIELEQHLSRLVGVPVDLVMRKALRPGIARNVLREMVPVW